MSGGAPVGLIAQPVFAGLSRLFMAVLGRQPHRTSKWKSNRTWLWSVLRVTAVREDSRSSNGSMEVQIMGDWAHIEPEWNQRLAQQRGTVQGFGGQLFSARSRGAVLVICSGHRMAGHRMDLLWDRLADHPENTRWSANAVLTLSHRLRRWLKIKTALAQYLMIATPQRSKPLNLHALLGFSREKRRLSWLFRPNASRALFS